VSMKIKINKIRYTVL